MELGRFNHHPDPAIDFCVEIECLEGMAFDASVGLADWKSVAARIGRAMAFVVGGDQLAVVAKDRLRDIHATLCRITQ